jgi:hypothetical protein
MNRPSDPVILICTVGGSPAPIRTALAKLRPSKVVFIVSEEKDGSPSSARVVDDAILNDGKPGLRHADGCPPSISLLSVPPDDPDAAFARIDTRLEQLRAQSPVVADYTGLTPFHGVLLCVKLRARRRCGYGCHAGCRGWFGSLSRPHRRP